MDVRVEEISAELGTKGILFRIYQPNGGPQIGRLRVGKATLRWYPGKTSKNYKQVSIEKFVEWLETQ